MKSWFAPVGGRTPAIILSVAQLDDDERTHVLSVVLEGLVTHVRGLPGSKRLRVARVR